MTFETERLLVGDLEEGDLEAALEVFLSNPSYLELTEGSAGEPGRYDLGMLRRDFVLAGISPGRHLAGIWTREPRELVGVLDWLEQHESDGLPWMGLLMVRADRQGYGVASEAFAGLAGLLLSGGAPAVRAGVVEGHEAGASFVERLGFRRVSAGSDVYERPLE